MNEYNKYLQEEKKYAEKFLKHSQILDDRFDENEYSLIKSIWLDKSLIDRIYLIIDDIILKHKLDTNIRFLIIGDFIFSLTSFDLHDPSELILKTSRSSYIYRIKLRASINILFGYEWINYIEMHKKLLIGLRVNKILKRTQIRTLKEGYWHTTIYFMLEISESFLDQTKVLGISKYPFIVVDILSIKYSVGSFRNLWKIKRKKREMEDVLICYSSIIKANQIGLKISSTLYKLNSMNIEKEKLKLLNDVNCNNLDQYFIKVKNIFKDDSYAAQLVSGREKIDDISYYDSVLLKRVIKKECINLMSRFQRLVAISQLEKNIFDILIYLPCFMDNRGRQYYSTLMSPTFHIIFRYLYEFVIEKTFMNLSDSKFYNEILKYSYTIENLNLDKIHSYVAIILFIEVGKFFIKNTNEYHIKTEKIIELGIKNYKIKNLEIKFDDLLYIKKIFYLLDRLLLENIIENNALIFKDATASGLQNYGILLGYKEDKLKYLNIDGEDWYDTYQYIINKYLYGTNLSKRKYWKGTLMTIPYNASWYTCFLNFIECLREDGIEYNELIEKEQVKESHKNFYKTVKEEIKKEFFINKSGNLKVFKYNKWEVVNVSDYKINYNRCRDKYRSTIYMISEDLEATQRALEANNMHYLDAALVKHLIEKFDIITVHDCFAIRLCEMHLLIDAINEYYSKIIKKSTYCIHIII